MYNIAIIGAGQLGSRHLQALVQVKHEIKIQVVDSSIESLTVAETRFNEVASNFTGKISFHEKITELDKQLDVVIIATSSKVRRVVLEQLVENSKVKNLILEKVLFTKLEDYPSVQKLITSHSIKTWVNCPRRMMSYYQKIAQEISGPVHFMATGNAWGMGCNGIHFLDLFAFISKSKDIVLSNHLIDKEIIESKRSGYIEITGTLTGSSSDSSFHLTSFPNNSSPISVVINSPTARYFIEESPLAKVRVSKLENNWKWQEEEFTMPFQSQLTAAVVNELIETGTCHLTTYEESTVLHLAFLNNLISFMKQVNSDNTIEECLIT